MTAVELIAAARALGADFVLKPDGGVTVKLGARLPPDVVIALKGAKPQIAEALRRERTRIDRWIELRIIGWNSGQCFACRRSFAYGAKWVELVNENNRCRFHTACLPLWQLEQEMAARRALGLTQVHHLYTGTSLTEARRRCHASSMRSRPMSR